MWLVAIASAGMFGCAGDVTEPPPITWTVWPDTDRDGYGAQVEEHREVSADTLGWAANRGDCDDSDPTVNPEGLDLCVEGWAVDLDCSGCAEPQDGSVTCDAEFSGCPLFADDDGDLFGGVLMVVHWYFECYFPEDAAGYVAVDGDCDDADPLVNPDAFELCDDVDNNCNERVDEGC